jgi:hypothetical protein
MYDAELCLSVAQEKSTYIEVSITVDGLSYVTVD